MPTTKSRLPGHTLTSIIRDPSPLINENAPPTRRSVRVELTDEQRRAMTLHYYESVEACFIEPEHEEDELEAVVGRATENVREAMARETQGERFDGALLVTVLRDIHKKAERACQRSDIDVAIDYVFDALEEVADEIGRVRQAIDQRCEEAVAIARGTYPEM